MQNIYVDAAMIILMFFFRIRVVEILPHQCYQSQGFSEKNFKWSQSLNDFLTTAHTKNTRFFSNNTTKRAIFHEKTVRQYNI